MLWQPNFFEALTVNWTFHKTRWKLIGCCYRELGIFIYFLLFNSEHILARISLREHPTKFLLRLQAYFNILNFFKIKMVAIATTQIRRKLNRQLKKLLNVTWLIQRFYVVKDIIYYVFVNFHLNYNLKKEVIHIFLTF